MKRRVILAGLGILILATYSTTAAESRHVRVLLLHSFGREFAPFNAFADQFRTELAQQSPVPVEFFDVPLVSDRFDQAVDDGPMLDYLRNLFPAHPPDLVVTVGGPAVRFAQRNRQRLFPATPMLLGAAEQRHVQAAALSTNDVVVPMKLDMAGVLKNILQILPGTTNLVVVIGDSPLEKFWVAEARREFAPFTNRVGFVWFNELSYNEMRQRAAGLPPRSAIFYGILCVDADGVPHEEERALAGLRQVANAPLFGAFDFQFGRGIVGGPLISVADLSRNGATVAVRILQGESPSRFRLQPLEAGKPVFDWRELRRWGIRESDLPPGSTVRLRQPSFWNLYRWWIAEGVIVCLLQAALIIALLMQRAKRRQGEAEAKLVADISSRFVNLPADQVDREILDAQRRICEFLGIEPSAFRQWSDKTPGSMALTHRHCAQEGLPPPEPQNQEELRPAPAGCGVAVSSPEEPPAEAPRGRETVRPLGVRSNLTNPLAKGGETRRGAQDSNPMPAERDWSDALVKRLQLVAQIFTNALARKHADQTSRESEARLRDLSGRLIHAHEEERARLARELHDDLTQRLAVLAIEVGRLERGASDASSAKTLRGVREGLVRLSEDVHALSYRLHPAVLEDLGLAEALKVECEHFSRREKISANVKLRDVPNALPLDLALCLFRVAQEALRNVARHARAGRVDVTLWRNNGGLQLSVRDDGVGFAPALQRERPSLGLASMRERVHLLEGELDIESAPGQGTTILVSIPLEKG